MLDAAAAAGLMSLFALVGCASKGKQASVATRPMMDGQAGGSFATAYGMNNQVANAPRSYWTAPRLARPAMAAVGRAGARRRAGQGGSRRDACRRVVQPQRGGGDHFCTASVVSSRSRDMLITAAHCVHGGQGSPVARGDAWRSGPAGQHRHSWLRYPIDTCVALCWPAGAALAP